MAPAHKITSPVAAPGGARRCDPPQPRHSAACHRIGRKGKCCTCACVQTSRLLRDFTGVRNALAVFQRQPSAGSHQIRNPRIVAAVKVIGLFKASLNSCICKGIQHLQLRRCFSMRHSPPWPCRSENRRLSPSLGSAHHPASSDPHAF